MIRIILYQADSIITITIGQVSMEDLLCLPNIGRTSALWLQTVGINNAEQLAEIGAVGAYLRINQRGIKTSKVLLYALHGALLNKHWNDLTTDEKHQLCQQAGIND